MRERWHGIDLDVRVSGIYSGGNASSITGTTSLKGNARARLTFRIVHVKAEEKE